MNSNKGATMAVTNAGLTEEQVIRMAQQEILKTKFIDSAGVLGEPGKSYKWIDVLPQSYKDEYAKTGKVRGWERQYMSPVMKAIKDKEDATTIRGIVAQQIEKRALKTKAMEGKAALKEEEKATRAATPRARTPARSAAERAEELEKKVAALKAKAEEEAKKKNIVPTALALARQMDPMFNSRRQQNQGKIMKNAEYALMEGGPSVSVANALRLAKTRRSMSRAASAAKKATATGMALMNMVNGEAAAVPVTTTRRNYKKEIQITDFCKEGMELQAKSATPLSVSDVLHRMAEARGSTRAKSSTKYASAKAAASKYSAIVNE